MDARKVLVAIAIAALASALAVDVQDEVQRIDPLSDGELVALLEIDAERTHKVMVKVVGKKVPVPKKTVKDLLPKAKAAEISKYKKKYKKSPNAKVMKSINKTAKIVAAKAINKAAENKVALRREQAKEKRLVKKMNRDKATVKKVEQNKAYAAKTKQLKVKRALKAANKKNARRNKRTKRSLAKLQKDKFIADHAEELKKREAKVVARDAAKFKAAEAKKLSAQHAVIRGVAIVSKYQGMLEKAKEDIEKSSHTLEHMEEHEEAAAVEKKEATIKVQYEKEDAKHTKVLLKKLKAKKAAVSKATRTLDQKAKRDFKAAKLGLAKSKGDYAAAKSRYDKFTKKGNIVEKKIVKANKLIALAVNGVVNGINLKKSADAIKSAENHGFETKHKAKLQKALDKENLAAKGQSKLMAGSETEMDKAMALDTVARREQSRVKQDRELMRNQVKKVRFLEKEVKDHEHNAQAAQKRAIAAVVKVKKMRKDAETTLKKARATKVMVGTIDMKLAKNAVKKAKRMLKKAEFDDKQDDADLEKARAAERKIVVKTQKAEDEKEKVKAKLARRIEKTKSAKKHMHKEEEAQRKEDYKSKLKYEAAKKNANRTKNDKKKAAKLAKKAAKAAKSAKKAAKKHEMKLAETNKDTDAMFEKAAAQTKMPWN